MHKLSSKLDWTRMLGFDQIAGDRLTANKNGGKLDAKIGGKPGLKAGGRIGGKIGSKSGIKN